jgi:hypothetical protein
MRKLIIGVLAGLLIGGLGVWAAPTILNTTVEYRFINGIRSASFLDLTGTAVLQAGAEGETIVNTVDGTFDLTRDESGTVTVTASDDDATAALTILPGGAAALVLGGASTTAVTLTSTGVDPVVDGVGFRVPLPTTQVIAATETIAADACGGIKLISSASAVTTNTTDTFTAPAAGNAGCIMHVCNVNAADAITLDDNTNFDAIDGANVVLTAGACIGVGSTGSIWKSLTPLVDGTS